MTTVTITVYPPPDQNTHAGVFKRTDVSACTNSADSIMTDLQVLMYHIKG